MLKTILKTTNKQKTDRLNPRTHGKSKALQTKSHIEAYTYTLTNRGKGKYIYISFLPKSTSSIWDDSLSIQVLHRCRVHQVDWRFNLLLLRLLGEISLSLLCSYSSWGSALDLAPPLHVGRLRVSVLSPDRMGLQEQLIWGLSLTQAGGRGGTDAGRACGSRGQCDVAPA